MRSLLINTVIHSAVAESPTVRQVISGLVIMLAFDDLTGNLWFPVISPYFHNPKEVLTITLVVNPPGLFVICRT